MHEVIVMGRKAGFDHDDWAKLAHSDMLMRATLNFVRKCETSNFPQTTPDVEKAELIAKLAKIVLPYTRKDYGCICCSENHLRGKSNGQRLLVQYTEIGLTLTKSEERNLQQGSCHQPLEMLFQHIKEFLGVESPSNSDWDLFSNAFSQVEKGQGFDFELECLATTVTSIANIIALKEAFAAQGLKLDVDLRFDKNKPEKTQ